MPDMSTARVHVMYLLKLADLNAVGNYSWRMQFWPVYIVA